ncbi:MAG: tRNA adenosine(34) deaminase TadA [Mariprofundaceae bacterium]|nr:tRNA adenosine(34) deaminase TadA [Mariprofundaceae bacterium]
MPEQYNHVYYMQLALQQAAQAAALDEVPVGAVLVCEDGQVFQAHNRPIAQHDATAHAEIEVIRLASQHLQNYRLMHSTLYVTLEPCLMCVGAIIHARIAHVVYGANEPKTGAVSSLYQALSDSRLNHQPTVQAGVLAEDCAQILKDFFKHKRQSKRL